VSFITCEFRFIMLRVVWISEIELIISENFKSPLVSPGELSKYGRKLALQLPMQSVPITTDVVSSNLDQSEVYNIMW
jgi:hypothetical protein